jgi:imidazolonepropionase-like amidohydrolase
MAEKKIFLVPTDPRLENMDEVLQKTFHMPADRVAQMKKEQAAAAKSRIDRAIKAGVRIAAGSDMYYCNPTWSRGSASLTPLESYAENGMPPIEVIRAATMNGADLLGMSRQLGSIEPGKFADIIGVAGDPLTDVSELRRVTFVMKGGDVIKH